MAVADDFLTFLPLFPDDDEEAILERLRGWANEGLDPQADADQWVDTREGSHWYISVMPAVREFARLYDLAGTEVPASALPLWAWGDYLDDQAEVQDIVRLIATPAEGEATFSGPPGTVIAAGTVVGVEPVSPDDDAPDYEVTTGGVLPAAVLPATVGVLTLPIRALDAGVAGNVGAGAVTVISTPLPAAVDVTNDDPVGGGTEPETDEALRERVLAAFLGQGAGNRRDYVRWARAWAGVGRATVIPLWDGPGTVKVIVTTIDGDPVSGTVVDGLQADLDPNPGMADGQAPVGAHVTVTTAIALPIDVDADVEFEDGYTLDGFGGTVAKRADIEATLRHYVERVESGGEIVVAQLAGRIVTVNGVHDVAITTPAANVQVADDPAEAPVLGTVTLTEAVL